MARMSDSTPPERTEEGRASSHHRIPLPGGNWQAWRRIGLRGAGFPARDVLGLAAPDAAAAVDRYLTGGEAPAVRTELEQTWAAELDRIFERAAAITRDPAFREAVTWQNRPVVHQTLDAFTKKLESRGWKARQRLAVIARYLQRYCTKNETIGFFGPWGWADIVDDGPLVSLETGPSLVSERRVHFEQWPLDAIAKELGNRFDLRPWAKPRLQPFLRAAEDRLVVPGRDPVFLPPQHLAVLRACDGTRPGREIAALAVEIGTPGVDNEEDAYNLLAQVQGLGAIAWGLELPLSEHPEDDLRAQLEEIGDAAIREPALAALSQLVAAKDAVAAATSRPAELDAAMNALEAEFTSLSGAPASRKPGELSAGRTLVYQDCLRDAKVTFGPDFAARIGPALSLVLEAFKWFTWEIAQHYLRAITEMFDEMAKAKDARELDLADLYSAFAAKYIFGEGLAVAKDEGVRAIVADYERKWAAMFEVDPASGTATRRSADIADEVRRVFAAPAAGWPGSYFTPNLLIAAEGIDALSRGELQVVLGKMHPGNTLLKSALAAFHPDRTALERALQSDHPGPHIAPIPARDLGPRRTSFTVTSPSNYWLHFSPDPPIGPKEQRLPLAELVARREEGGVTIHSRDGKVALPLVEVLAAWLAEVVHSSSNVLPSEEHRPRRVIDDLVIEREQWTFDASAVAFAQAEGLLDTFIEARRWAGRIGVPRYLYAKVDGEPKPVFLDMESPVYVDLVARMIRAAAKRDAKARASFTEMLPSLDHLWLTDENGRACTSELLLVTFEGGADAATARAAPE
jgi:hypothetical protein